MVVSFAFAGVSTVHQLPDHVLLMQLCDMIPHAFFRECDLVGSLLDPIRDAVIILQRFQRFITCENRHFPVYITLIDDCLLYTSPSPRD